MRGEISREGREVDEVGEGDQSSFGRERHRRIHFHSRPNRGEATRYSHQLALPRTRQPQIRQALLRSYRQTDILEGMTINL